MCEINDKNQLKKQFTSSRAFHRTPGGCVREITTGERLGLENLKLFDPGAQEIHRITPASNQQELKSMNLRQ
jgi:hypothetical protein